MTTGLKFGESFPLLATLIPPCIEGRLMLGTWEGHGKVAPWDKLYAPCAVFYANQRSARTNLPVFLRYAEGPRDCQPALAVRYRGFGLLPSVVDVTPDLTTPPVPPILRLPTWLRAFVRKHDPKGDKKYYVRYLYEPSSENIYGYNPQTDRVYGVPRAARRAMQLAVERNTPVFCSYRLPRKANSLPPLVDAKPLGSRWAVPLFLIDPTGRRTPRILPWEGDAYPDWECPSPPADGASVSVATVEPEDDTDYNLASLSPFDAFVETPWGYETP